MTARVLQITNGSDTVDFEDTNSGYTILRHRPAVSDEIDGLPERFAPVDEIIELSVEGSTPSELAQRLDLLTQLVNQARRKARGEEIDPVLYKYLIDQSTLTNPLQAMIIGPPEQAEVLTLPESFDSYTQLKTGSVGDPVIWRFRRRGELLGDEDSDNSGAAADNPSVLTATNTATDQPSPIELQLTNFTSAPWGGSYILVTDDADKLEIFSVSTMQDSGPTNFVTTADASKSPLQGTNVLRYTPPDTDWNYSGNYDIKALLLSDTRRIAVYFNARRNSAAVEALVKIKLTPQTGGYNTLAADETKPKQLVYTVSGSYTQVLPQWYFAGILELPVDLSVVSAANLSIGVKASLAASNIDFDAICLMDVRDKFSQAVFLPSSDATGITPTLTIDHNLLSEITPQAYVTSGSIVMNVSTQGTKIFMGQVGEVAGIWLATSRDWSGPGYAYWCARSTSGAAKLQNVMTAIRRPGYLVPQ